MRIMLTGGSGLAGHSILEADGIEKFEVMSPSHQEMDLLDFSATYNYLMKCKPDFVIHAAGLVGGIEANRKAPMMFLLQNLDMGRNLIYACYQAGVKHLINLGSSCMYPKDSDTSLSEDMVLQGELEPTNEGYALAKIVCARLCSYISREHPELQYKTLIPCNLYGRWDKFRSERAHMIPAAIHKLHEAKRQNLPCVEIWGTGTARREFLYSEDFGACVVYCLEHFQAMPDMMNVGLGHDYTIDEYYQAAAEVVGYQGSFMHDTAHPEGMKRKLTDISRQLSFGWKARTSLSEGLSKTYEFYLQTDR